MTRTIRLSATIYTQEQIDQGLANNQNDGFIVVTNNTANQITGLLVASPTSNTPPTGLSGGTSGEFRKVTLVPDTQPTGISMPDFNGINNSIAHAESNITSVLLEADNFVDTQNNLKFGSFYLFNYTGIDLVVRMIDGTATWSGGISGDGETTNDVFAPFTTSKLLVTIPHAKKCLIVFDRDGFIQASILGIEVTQAELNTHTNNVSNPHVVTKTQVGLANVTNDAQLKISSNLSDLNNIATAKTNLSLNNVDNTSDSNKPLSDVDLNIKNKAFTITKSVGHPINFTSATKTETEGDYVVSASSEFSSAYAGWKAFDGIDTNDWATQGVTSNFWVRLQLPVKKLFTRIIARGRNSGTERITSWKIEASDISDFSVKDELYSSTTTLGNTAQTFDFTNKKLYTYYRLFAVTAEAGNIGLSRLEFHEESYTSTPATHSHTISDVTSLQTTLDSKASSTHTHAQSDITNLTTDLSNKQATLVSATNIKTVNSTSLLGSGDIAITAAMTGVPQEINQLAIKTEYKVQPDWTSAANVTGTLGAYAVAASSIFNDTYGAWRCVQADGSETDWATNSVTANFWHKITLPIARIPKKVIIRGRDSNEAPSNWRLEGSNDDTNWTTLFTSSTTIINTADTTISLSSNITAYKYLRMFAVTGTGTNPGLKKIKWFAEAITLPTTSV